MNPWFVVLAALGGGAGAGIRFLVDGAISSRSRRAFPWGIFVVNSTGSLALGFLVGLAESSVLSAPWLFVLGTGVLGGYTTFSTAMVDVVGMLRERRPGRAAANAFGMLLVTVALAAIGVAIGRAL